MREEEGNTEHIQEVMNANRTILYKLVILIFFLKSNIGSHVNLIFLIFILFVLGTSFLHNLFLFCIHWCFVCMKNLLCDCWELNPDSQQEQQSLLTVPLSISPATPMLSLGI